MSKAERHRGAAGWSHLLCLGLRRQNENCLSPASHIYMTGQQRINQINGIRNILWTKDALCRTIQVGVELSTALGAVFCRRQQCVSVCVCVCVCAVQKVVAGWFRALPFAPAAPFHHQAQIHIHTPHQLLFLCALSLLMFPQCSDCRRMGCHTTRYRLFSHATSFRKNTRHCSMP